MAEAKKKSTKKETKEAELIVEAVVEKPAEEKPAAEAKAEKAPAKPAAKAGKRSPKAVAEAEEKSAKMDRRKASPAQTSETEVSAGKKPSAKPARSKVEQAGKKYRELAAQVDKSKNYTLAEALGLATKTNPAKFDATVELHVNLGVDPKQADQNIRDVVSLPAGTGKTVRIAVFAEGDDATKAKAAGADVAGTDEITKMLDNEELTFDVLISTPALMGRLGKYARLLGPRGLMPNPKSGTVSANVESAVTQAKAGRVEYRVDPTGIVHLGIGKVSFGPAKLLENAQAIMASLRQNKPASLKGIYIKSITVSSTMGPGIKVEP